jgi:hypothetical protein
MLLDESSGPSGIASGLGMADGVVDQVVLLVPSRGGSVQFPTR